ncbi:glucans biosynthesis glucosyltransferase MdoH [Azohydromonas caseinilytica]|uniref:glucans biosynthesis glucosyltransferase MdoH n=1 Tax=Azohydromonas caseinilytica TaxID=2728836 RepID=UPI00197B6AE4|nr:glucans biosynthesis glucosyltransferase MdoH [Azohydromonas caseinilytica]
MPARPWSGPGAALRARLQGTGGGERARARTADAAEPPWHAAARRRRTGLLGAVTLSAGIATLVLAQPAVADGLDLVEAAHLLLFFLLFGWVSAGCFTAVAGYLCLRRGDPHTLSPQVLPQTGPTDPAARVALTMPICNEDIDTVFAGLRETCESLRATGREEAFDLFILSDSSDPALRAAELRAWRELRAQLGSGLGERIYYRHRRRRTRRKAGNVADFCRRWGALYRYMVVLDADSVMTGECLVKMQQLMEQHPRIGILQTQPVSRGHDTLHARAQQFLGRVAAPLFAAGLRCWQLGESHYWGHNAMLRVAPFMQHCGLAPLPRRGGLGGEILSHDFVEAALIRRAGYEVWLVDLPGSFEQPPAHLLDELQRDRRWCQGNLQNVWLVAEPGFAPVHRAMFFSGALSYVASPLWLLFMVLGVFSADDGAGHVFAGAPLLWALTLAMLAAPRALGVALVIRRGQAAAYGGVARLVIGSLLEALLSALQAPLRMLAHTVFVVGALTGLKLDWKSPSRDAVALRWRDALRRFGPWAVPAAAVAWLAEVPTLAPVWLPLLLAVPLAVWTSRPEVGAWLRRRGVWLTPDELQLADTPARFAPRPARPAPLAPVVVRRPAPQGFSLPPLASLLALRPQQALARAMAMVALAIPVVPAVLTPERTRVSVAYLMAEPAPYEGRTAAATLKGREKATKPGKRRYNQRTVPTSATARTSTATPS